MSAEEDRVSDGVVALRTPELKPYGLSRSAAYELIKAGAIDVVKLGGRRFIPRKALVERLARGLVPATAGH